MNAFKGSVNLLKSMFEFYLQISSDDSLCYEGTVEYSIDLSFQPNVLSIHYAFITHLSWSSICNYEL